MARRILLGVAAPALAMAIALGVSSLVLLASDNAPLEIYESMWSFGTQLNSIISMINRAVPYYLAGLAVAIGFKMNLFNIGVEGQYYFAALIAGIVGAAFTLPSVLHVLAILLIAMASGAFLAGIAGVLKATRGVNEVISTIMLNNIVLGGFGAWLLTRARYDDGSGSLQIATEPIAESGRIPNLNRWLEAIGVDVPAGARLTGFLLVAIVVGVVYYLIIWRSRFGFDLRASGMNPWAARSSGVDAKGMVVKAMLLSGGMAGLVGLSSLLVEDGRFAGDFQTGIGFTGIAVALVGRNHPVGIALGALLWGFMERSAQRLDLEGVPKEIVVIMQGTIVLSVVVAYEVVRRARAAQQQREVSAQVDDERVADKTVGVPA
ncbi:MAG: ABC transporter permease [Acidimicrobiia bacterium]|jgi:general nucleoside transport system permease protein